MIIALSTWNDRIAPVFDVAVHLLLVEVDEGEVNNQRIEQLPKESTLGKAIKIQSLGVTTLICGAVSKEAKSFLDMYGINVTAFISGNVHKILQLLLSDNFNEADFAMPGCQKQKRNKKGVLLCRKKRKVNP